MNRRTFLLRTPAIAALGHAGATAAAPVAATPLRIGIIGLERQGIAAADALHWTASHWLDQRRFSFRKLILVDEAAAAAYSERERITPSFGPSPILDRALARGWMDLKWLREDLKDLDCAIVCLGLEDEHGPIHWVKNVVASVLLKSCANEVPCTMTVVLDPWIVVRRELVPDESRGMQDMRRRLSGAAVPIHYVPNNCAREARLFIADRRVRNGPATKGLLSAYWETRWSEIDSLSAPVIRLFAQPGMINFRPSQLARNPWI